MRGTISRLRDLVPLRALTRAEALRVAELQASRVLEIAGIDKPLVPESIITTLPRLQVERLTPSPVSGATQWSRGRWLILLSGSEPLTRQRFSLAHEFKHIIDNPFVDLLYPAGTHGEIEVEQICDYFAGCLLMPRPWVKRYWCGGTQDLRRLAQQFCVSPSAMQVRLLQIGLIEPPARCSGRSYARQAA